MHDRHDSPHDRRRSSRNTIPGNFDRGTKVIASRRSPFLLAAAAAAAADGGGWGQLEGPRSVRFAARPASFES
eukprot:scaffold3667_cov110-Isochrysis_galbana.AAC.16